METSDGPSHLLAFKHMLEDQIKIWLSLGDDNSVSKADDKEDGFTDDKDNEKRDKKIDPIVDITFGYGNHRLLKLLEDRAV